MGWQIRTTNKTIPSSIKPSHKTVYMQIDYIIQKSRRKSISIKLTQDGKILAKAPTGIPVSAVEDFIRSKQDWIQKQLQKQEEQSQLAKQLGSLSREDLIKIKKQAKKVIPQRVEYYARLAGISYNRIFIRLQKSRWGSCSTDGNLNFNCLLILMPMEILDSVVVHELCHRRHMNHSKAFYDEVLRIFPNYKACDKWLKQNGPAYFKRLESD